MESAVMLITRLVIAAPPLVGARYFGVIGVYKKDQAYYTEEDVTILETLLVYPLVNVRAGLVLLRSKISEWTPATLLPGESALNTSCLQ